ncbi:hypothetical protein AKJ45_01860 [candidate division MSBL1 archaeon SCGC-AAA261F19]|uniref:HTH asnC-type domain-containing protein n=1 Tax=candidate division MSBL1 archaeon SCGC-AAA261F19 TaxID=1698275 RepID=A0A133VA83_9EURY|nr:hypothetical protein AKJ45_01860 [candidate division MSBL1 archaeon SCGC-AAA261F19]
MKGEKILKLDATDKKLLNLLQRNSKQSYADLAERLEISSSGAHKRTKRLAEEGVIKRFVAVVDPLKAGKRIKALIGVSTKPGRCGDVRPRLIERPDVLEVHETAGEHDLSIKLITKDTQTLNKLIHEIDRIPGVDSTRTSIVLKTEKETTAIKL